LGTIGELEPATLPGYTGETSRPQPLPGLVTAH
jgi:hypothetical protein